MKNIAHLSRFIFEQLNDELYKNLHTTLIYQYIFITVIIFMHSIGNNYYNYNYYNYSSCNTNGITNVK
jgi:hypothetical protein